MEFMKDIYVKRDTVSSWHPTPTPTHEYTNTDTPTDMPTPMPPPSRAGRKRRDNGAMVDTVVMNAFGDLGHGLAAMAAPPPLPPPPPTMRGPNEALGICII